MNIDSEAFMSSDLDDASLEMKRLRNRISRVKKEISTTKLYSITKYKDVIRILTFRNRYLKNELHKLKKQQKKIFDLFQINDFRTLSQVLKGISLRNNITQKKESDDCKLQVENQNLKKKHHQLQLFLKDLHAKTTNY